MAGADGKISLHIDVAKTREQIRKELNEVFKSNLTHDLVVKTAINRDETKKQVDAMISELNASVKGLDLKVNTKDVKTVLKQQEKDIKEQAKALSKILDTSKMWASNKLLASDGADSGLKKSFDEIADKAEQLQKKLKNVSPEGMTELKKDIKSLGDALTETISKSKQFKDTNTFAGFETSVNRLKKQVEDFGKKYTAIRGNPKLAAEFERISNAVNNIKTVEDLGKLKGDFAKLGADVEDAGLMYKQFGQSFGGIFSQLTYFFSAARLFQEAISSIKKMVQAVREIDTAMVELRKVTSESDGEINSFFERAKTNAVALGTTIKDLVNATADFARLGYSLTEAEELGKVASIYQNVGDDVNSIDQASQSLISTMKGFGLQAEDSMSIIDKFNEVGM